MSISFSYKAALPEDIMVEMMIEAARHHIRVGNFTPNILDLYERVNRAGPARPRSSGRSRASGLARLRSAAPYQPVLASVQPVSSTDGLLMKS